MSIILAILGVIWLIAKVVVCIVIGMILISLLGYYLRDIDFSSASKGHWEEHWRVRSGKWEKVWVNPDGRWRAIGNGNKEDAQ